MDLVKTDGASDVGISCDSGPDNQPPTTSTRIPKTPINRLRSPSSSNPTTPYTSTPATPHISRPGTPPADRPEARGHLPNIPLASRARTQENIPTTPPIARTTKQPFPISARSKALGTQVLLSRPVQPGSLALLATKPRAPRHFKSTPHLTAANKPTNPPQPATWPATQSHASSIGRPYT